MAYSYFTKKLLDKSSEIDISNIFPDKQERAKERLNTNYSLAQIVDWIKENTNNFKKSENYYIDLDQAIQRLVYKYYESTNKVNPFVNEVIEVEEVSSEPRKPAEVNIGAVKNVAVEELKEEIKDSISEVIAEPTKQDYLNVIEVLEMSAEMDAENPMYAPVIEALKMQVELMD